MKKIILISIFLIFTARNSMANLQAINIGAINGWKSLEEDIDYLWVNQGMYRHYQITWSFPETRESVIAKLETLLKKLNALEPKNKKNIDYYLLKGDIAHYLYNLDATKYYKPALEYYETAKKLDKKDYRPNWFIGQHQCLSGHDIPGIESYREIINEAEPSSLHWAFWGDYSDCAIMGIMHFNHLMAFEHMSKNKDEFKKIQDEPYYDSYKKIKDLILTPDPDKKYDNNVFWKKVSDQEIYVSVPLGIRINSKKDWESKFTAFDKRINIAMLDTGSVKGNPAIKSRISVITYIPKSDEERGPFIEKCIKSFPNVKKIVIKNNFNTEEIYESMDTESMKEQGGKRINMMFIERNEADYPGTAVEYPLLNETGNMVYAYEKFYSRFKGKIFYFIMLESPESIYKQSFRTFSDFISKDMILD